MQHTFLVSFYLTCFDETATTLRNQVYSRKNLNLLGSTKIDKIINYFAKFQLKYSRILPVKIFAYESTKCMYFAILGNAHFETISSF